MKTRKLILLALITILFASPQSGFVLHAAPGLKTPAAGPAPAILPKPLDMRVSAAVFVIRPSTRILVDAGEEADRLGQYLSQEIRNATGLVLPVSSAPIAKPETKPCIILTSSQFKKELGPEGYELSVKPTGVRLRAMTFRGLFHGIQTIRQLLPPAPAGSGWTEPSPSSFNLPCVQVEDAPRFSWRGLNLDCSRHFMPKDFIKRTIDLLAMFKMNRFHWHLSDDQGWRVEIKKYPDLTRKGAWRKLDNGTTYGGFYTQDDVREIVAYAAGRYIMVIPEIEMPGHSAAALAAYPELSCSGGPFEVQNYWGIHADVICAGSDKAFEILEGVLSEVADLFPSPYIHIGGDECPKDRWKACPLCQARIKSERLKDESELQSYFIRRIEKYLQSKNRRLIGWDEILEGGLPPQATVQSWRGFEGAVAAARSGHDTIVSPTRFTYFDYSLQKTSLSKVYEFEPVPDGLGQAVEHHILGGECNMWTEYAPEETIDGKLFPRILALAERLWSPKKAKDFSEFQPRAWKQADRLRTMGVQVGDECHPLTIVPAFDRAARKCSISLKSEENSLILRLTTDGSEPTLGSPRYDRPLTIPASCRVRARAFKGGRPYGETAVQDISIHEALGQTILLTNGYSPKRRGGGDQALTDGIRGDSDLNNPAWQGYEGVDMEATVDLGAKKPIRKVACGFLQNSSKSVFVPALVEFSVSDDGRTFQPLGSIDSDLAKNDPEPKIKEPGLEPQGVQGRYVRISARSSGRCPPAHPAAGQKSWIFADEIIVE